MAPGHELPSGAETVELQETPPRALPGHSLPELKRQCMEQDTASNQGELQCHVENDRIAQELAVQVAERLPLKQFDPKLCGLALQEWTRRIIH